MRLSETIFAFVLILWTNATTVDMPAQEPLRFNQIVLKGTHNSYAGIDCDPFLGKGNECPVMHNPPSEQIDDWGVWAIELDFSFARSESGQVVPWVGHDGRDSCHSFALENWNDRLENYLLAIRESRSFAYRPVVIKFEYKDWGLDTYDDPALAGDSLEVLLVRVFGEHGIFGPRARDSALMANGGLWPTVDEMAGKIVPYTIFGYGSDQIYDQCPLSEAVIPQYSDSGQVQSMIESGKQVIFLDQYQVDWTFRFAAPPNPIYVSGTAVDSTWVDNRWGKICSTPENDDPTDPGRGFPVGEQGTFRFPFRTVGSAIARASAYPGWTILISPGSYPETITVNASIKIKADGGTVVIGKYSVKP